MTRTRCIGLVLVLMSSCFSLFFGLALTRGKPNRMSDFQAVYFAARCVLQHRDPYQEGEFLKVFTAEGGQFPADPRLNAMFRKAVPICVNLPSTLLLVSPLAMIGYPAAQAIWVILTVGAFSLAAFLMWDLAAAYAPAIALFLICVALANCESFFAIGNAAGPVIALCGIAVWCFLKDRYVFAGILCLAVSLAIKPHDVGFVWLYFLLAGGTYRKRALLTLAATAAICLPALLWTAHVAPDWMHELHSNLAIASAHGDINDPGPAGFDGRMPGAIVSLQAVFSIVRDDPRFYNWASYLVSGALLAVWFIRTLRSRASKTETLLALASIAALSMLPTYHRHHDARLLLLAVPACAMLWARRGAMGWLALALTTAGLLADGDISLTAFTLLTRSFHPSLASAREKLLTVAIMRPAPLILLSIAVFYLWAYVLRTPAQLAAAQSDVSGGSLAEDRGQCLGV